MSLIPKVTPLFADTALLMSHPEFRRILDTYIFQAHGSEEVKVFLAVLQYYRFLEEQNPQLSPLEISQQLQALFQSRSDHRQQLLFGRHQLKTLLP